MTRWLLPAGLFLALSTALAFPLFPTFASALPHDVGDPVLNTWILWWSTQRLPFTEAWWNAPMFFPMQGALALSEVLLGLVPITAPITWLTGSPVAAYNVAFVLTFPLCALAAYALALELTGRRDASLLAGLAFAFSPYRMGQLAHIQMLAYYGAPIALFGLHRFVRTRQRRWLALFGAAWLVQSLSNGYALFHLGVLVAAWIVWFARPRSLALPILATWAVASLPLAPVLLTYQRIHGDLHLTRSINEVEDFGLDLTDLFTASPELLFWGDRLWPARSETTAFPGLVVLAFAAVALVVEWRRSRGRRSRRTRDQQVLIGIAAVAGLVALSFYALGPWRIGPLTVSEFRKPFSIAVAARLLASLRGERVRQAWRDHSVVGFYVIALIGLYVLALGPEPRLSGRPLIYEPPYAWLMHLPGFATLRVPARFVMLAVLCQSVLMAWAIASASGAPNAAASRLSLGSGWRRRVAVAAIAALIVVEGWVVIPAAAMPMPGPRWEPDVQAVVEVPIGEAYEFGAIARGLQYGRPLVNGYSGHVPPHYLPLVYAMRHGQFEVLHELSADGPLGIALSLPDNAGVHRDAIAALPGVTARAADARWITLALAPRPRAAASPGRALPLGPIRVNRHPEDVGRLTDGETGSAWSTGNNQIGDEELVVDLQQPQTIGAVVLAMSSFSFGFPRDLAIDVSPDGVAWTTVLRRDTAVLTVRAAVQDPPRVPLTLEFPAVEGRFVRLRQLGAEPGVPWWVAELSVHAPR